MNIKTQSEIPTKHFVDISFRQYSDKMIEVFGENAIVGICFILATIFKTVILQKTGFFPLLGVFGPKASGKTEIAKSLAALAGIEYSALFFPSMTISEFRNAIQGKVNNPIIIDDYKELYGRRKRELLLGIYDNIKSVKGRPEIVNCSAILCGQNKPSDKIMMSRMIYLPLTAPQYTEEDVAHFKELQYMSFFESHPEFEVLKYEWLVRVAFKENYNIALSDLGIKYSKWSYEERIAHNWALSLAIGLTLLDVLHLSFNYATLVEICHKMALNQINEII